MAKKDLRINEYGIDVRNLVAGQWVNIKWNDAPVEKCLLLKVEKRAASYKGTRSLKLFCENDWEWFIQKRAESDQVCAVLGDINTVPLTLK